MKGSASPVASVELAAVVTKSICQLQVPSQCAVMFWVQCCWCWHEDNLTAWIASRALEKCLTAVD
jgi:hypothetical protein